MRALFLVFVFALPLLTGCAVIARQNGDYFEAGADVARFEADAQSCGLAATDYADYDLRGMGGSFYERNRTYNAVYGRCMQQRGYRPRPYSKNWLPAG